MSERQRSLARIVALQGTVKAIAAFRVARAEASQAGIVAAREALQSFVDGAELTGAFALMAASQTRALAAQEVEAEARRLALVSARQAAETRLTLAERLRERVAHEDEAVAEREGLERLIAEAVGRAAEEPDSRP